MNIKYIEAMRSLFELLKQNFNLDSYSQVVCNQFQMSFLIQADQFAQNPQTSQQKPVFVQCSSDSYKKSVSSSINAFQRKNVLVTLAENSDSIVIVDQQKYHPQQLVLPFNANVAEIQLDQFSQTEALVYTPTVLQATPDLNKVFSAKFQLRADQNLCLTIYNPQQNKVLSKFIVPLRKLPFEARQCQQEKRDFVVGIRGIQLAFSTQDLALHHVSEDQDFRVEIEEMDSDLMQSKNEQRELTRKAKKEAANVEEPSSNRMQNQELSDRIKINRAAEAIKNQQQKMPHPTQVVKDVQKTEVVQN